MLRLVSLLLLLVCFDAYGACSGSGLTWTCTTGSTQANVQSAINSATDGATITFDAGSYTWTGTAIEFSNTKGVTLICTTNGDGDCAVTTGSATVLGMGGTLSGTNAKDYRVSGFTFTHNGSGTPLSFWFYGTGTYQGSTTVGGIRIDHNWFHDYASSSILIFFGCTTCTQKTFGVIDHNTITGTHNVMLMKVLGPLQNSVSQGDDISGIWSSTVRGTYQNIFLEDNTLTFTNDDDLGSGCIDAWQGQGVVWRYNTSTDCLVTAHDIGHNLGSINFEVYNNSLSADNGSVWNDGHRLIHHQGSGEMYIYNNSFGHTAAFSSSPIDITHYPSCPPAITADGALCDTGTQTYNGNVSGQRGWACWFQPGRQPSATHVWGDLAPIYLWNNTDASNGNLAPVDISNPFGGCTSPTYPTPPGHIISDRDYYQAVSKNAQTSSSSPFDGTTGMGFGTSARRPSTCSTGTDPESSGLGGVGYWDTDNSILYRCTSGNNWTVQYQPYTYPHPLVGGGGTSPSAPTNFRFISFLGGGLVLAWILVGGLYGKGIARWSRSAAGSASYRIRSPRNRAVHREQTH